MKSLVVLFFGILFWTQPAFALPADISFFTKRGELFQVVLDGRLINRASTDRVRLRAIPAGYHVAEIRFPDRFGALVHRTRIYVEPGYNTEFLVQLAGRKPKVLLNKIAQYPLRSSQPYPPNYRDRETYPNRERYDDRGEYDNRDRGNYQDDDYRDNASENQDRDYREESSAVLRSSEIDRLVLAIKNRPFDDDKFSLARQALSNSTFYAEDLKRVLNQFSYDSKKLELAKSLYRNVYDPRNFYVVYDAFRFNSDRRELERFVDSQSR